MAETRRWTFFRAGGFDQVKLATGADLVNLDKLDQKLWVALACPTSGLEIDPRTLALIDADKDGRVRAPELIAAVKFATGNLKNPDDLLKGAATLPLGAIDDSTPEGATLLASARQVLTNIGKQDATSISIEDVSDPAKIFAETAFNGDGVIIEASGSDDATRAVIREILDTMGSDPDRSGKPGIGTEKIDAFFAEIEAHGEWYAKAENDAARVFPLGPEKTAAAAEAVSAVRAKVEDYFGRCRLAAFDPRTVAILNRKEEEYLEVAAGDFSITADEVAGFPLAQIAPLAPLPLGAAVNPAHAGAVKALAENAIAPLLGAREHVAEADWASLRDKLAPYEAWLAEKQGPHVEKLGEGRIRAIRASAAKETLAGLIAKDKALEAEATSIESVERLVRYHRDLYLLCTNFVNFEDFYDGAEPATFQCGTLYLDQRACRLCLRVEDLAKHATMASLAGSYLAYLDCTRKATSEKMHIVAAFTAGHSDNLMVGRNGVFYDRQGRDWDATITKIIDNPISIRQAFWAPYRKFARLLEEQVAKRAAAADAQSHGALTAAATTAVNVDKTKPPEPKKIDVGTVAALGVAVGAIGTFFTALVGYATGVINLGLLPTTLAVVGVMMLISTPSVILAYIKLRKRNLGPLLDASGWAVNANAKINVPFGATLTSVAKLPPGSRRNTNDRFADKGLPWKRVLLLVLIVYGAYRWYHGSFDGLLPEKARSKTVLGRFAPGPETPPATTTVSTTVTAAPAADTKTTVKK
ncbi:MAG TPA: hypothetical protein VGP07_12290 [Polyangia bacterium]|jgi:hypothetical protein